ncbi:MAG: hypothetical protein HY869_02405 [Chloroflexi bacterium]|nr:hypothetical protein [Chloroflexota bacterium]
MKSLRLALCGFVLLLLTACSSIESKPLKLELALQQKEFHSLDEIRFQVFLSNQSDSDLLVHKRLSWMAYPAPPFITELAILISDASGKPVDEKGFYVNRDSRSEKTLGRLKPGEQIGKMIYLKHGFQESTLKSGETYTIVVIYQNDLDITQTIGGVEVPSWVGSVRSNEETFVILP